MFKVDCSFEECEQMHWRNILFIKGDVANQDEYQNIIEKMNGRLKETSSKKTSYIFVHMKEFFYRSTDAEKIQQQNREASFIFRCLEDDIKFSTIFLSLIFSIKL